MLTFFFPYKYGFFQMHDFSQQEVFFTNMYDVTEQTYIIYLRVRGCKDKFTLDIVSTLKEHPLAGSLQTPSP